MIVGSMGLSSKFPVFTRAPVGAVFTLEGDTDFNPVDDKVVLEVGFDFVNAPFGVFTFELARESVVDEEERFDVEGVAGGAVFWIVPEFMESEIGGIGGVELRFER